MISNEKAREILDGAPEGAENFGSSDSGVSYYRCSAYGWEIYVGKEWGDVDKSCGWFTTELGVLEAQLESAESITNSEEWEDYPPVGINVMVDYCDDDGSDIWVGFHGPSKVIAYSGDHVWIAHHGVHNRIHNLCDVEFKRVETPEELAAKARYDAAYDLFITFQSDFDPSRVSFDRFIKDRVLDKWLAIVDKTKYRVEE